MARDPQVSQNYAQALFNVMQTQRMPLDEALQEVFALRRLLLRETKFRTFLEGPQFREDLKEELTTKALQGQLSKVFYQFIILLLRHNRVEHLLDILDEFENLALQQKGITAGTVTTAVPISDEEKRMLQEKLEATLGLNFELKFKVDSKLIGGVRMQYGDILMDSSIATYLNDLRRRLASTRLAS